MSSGDRHNGTPVEELLRQLPRPAAPPGLYRAVMARIAEDARARSSALSAPSAPERCRSSWGPSPWDGLSVATVAGALVGWAALLASETGGKLFPDMVGLRALRQLSAAIQVGWTELLAGSWTAVSTVWEVLGRLAGGMHAGGNPILSVAAWCAAGFAVAWMTMRPGAHDPSRGSV